jgi:hypothetical protein
LWHWCYHPECAAPLALEHGQTQVFIIAGMLMRVHACAGLKEMAGEGECAAAGEQEACAGGTSASAMRLERCFVYNVKRREGKMALQLDDTDAASAQMRVHA